jgi:hypothetical protein
LAWYVFSEVFDRKPTSRLYLKNSAHLSNFLPPRTVSARPTARMGQDNLARVYPEGAARYGEDCLPNATLAFPPLEPLQG